MIDRILSIYVHIKPILTIDTRYGNEQIDTSKMLALATTFYARTSGGFPSVHDKIKQAFLKALPWLDIGFRKALYVSAIWIRVSMIFVSVLLAFVFTLQGKPEHVIAFVSMLPAIWGYIFSDLMFKDLKRY